MEWLNAIVNGIDFVNGKVSAVVWGPIMLTLLIGTGLFLSIRTGFLQFRKFGYMMKNTILSVFSKNQHEKDNSGVSPFQAVATAMAGTIGTGSIAGIATAIVAGGPGAVFWMWISALLGMVTKYSEIVLSLSYREKNEDGRHVGGPMYYIKNGLKAKWLAALFAIFAMLACLGTGNATQSNSISSALKETVGINPMITGIVLTVIVAIVILGGVKRIASINEKLVPFMAVFFVVCSVIALVVNAGKIPAAFALIFKEAFNFKAAFGGAAGYGIMTAMRFGFEKGVFSNEAGLGSAPIAHAASSTKDPVKQGLWGMFEVFFTTIIICTMSALVILTSGIWKPNTTTPVSELDDPVTNIVSVYDASTTELEELTIDIAPVDDVSATELEEPVIDADPTEEDSDTKKDGAALSIASFNSILPGFGGVIVTLATIFFALSTILGWAYYGEVCIEFLSKNSKKAVLAYRIVYVAFVFIGAVGNLALIWSISATMNGLMAIPNLIALIGLSSVIKKATDERFNKLK